MQQGTLSRWTYLYKLQAIFSNVLQTLIYGIQFFLVLLQEEGGQGAHTKKMKKCMDPSVNMLHYNMPEQ